jgi:hypothetical protein
MQTFKTTNIDDYIKMISGAVISGLTFTAYTINDQYIIEYLGGY